MDSLQNYKTPGGNYYHSQLLPPRYPSSNISVIVSTGIASTSSRRNSPRLQSISPHNRNIEYLPILNEHIPSPPESPRGIPYPNEHMILNIKSSPCLSFFIILAVLCIIVVIILSLL